MIVKNAVFISMTILTLCAFMAQIAIDPSAHNFISVCVVTASSFAMLFYLWLTPALTTHPLSSFSLLGFCVSTQLGALIVQSFTWHALTSSLYDPFYTFATLAFYQAIAMAVHATLGFFSNIESSNQGVARSLLEWFGVYKIPTSATLWFMGWVGLVSFIFSSRENALAKLSSAFNFLAWAPFLIPIYTREVGNQYCNVRRNTALLITYAAGLGLMAIGMNIRKYLFVGGATVFLLYALVALRSSAHLNKQWMMRIGVAAIVLSVLFVPLSDLATAMAVVRQSRGKLPAAELVAKTFYVWRSPRLIQAYRMDAKVALQGSIYDEYYFANPMIARFVETKFHDNSLHFARKITSDGDQRRLVSITADMFWAALPAPFLSVLGVAVRKDELNFSVGDYLVYLGAGLPLGGKKTGSMLAQGQVLMGPLFPFVYALICWLLFSLMDLLTVRTLAGGTTVSALAMMNIWDYYLYGLTSDGLHAKFVFVVRDFAQWVVIYGVILALAGLLLREKLRSNDLPQ